MTPKAQRRILNEVKKKKKNLGSGVDHKLINAALDKTQEKK